MKKGDSIATITLIYYTSSTPDSKAPPSTARVNALVTTASLSPAIVVLETKQV